MSAILRPARGGNRAKLSMDDVQWIRRSGAHRRLLAKRYGVTPQTIDNVRARRTFWWLK
jgi:hypothetical protein